MQDPDDNNDDFNDTKCAKGFKDYVPTSNFCYMIQSRSAATWENANSFCNLKQGSLIMPKNKEQDDMVKYVTEKQTEGIGFWIGLHKHRRHENQDSDADGRWAWNDGKYLTSDGWKAWEKHGDHKQDCVILSQNRIPDK